MKHCNKEVLNTVVLGRVILSPDHRERRLSWVVGKNYVGRDTWGRGALSVVEEDGGG